MKYSSMSGRLASSFLAVAFGVGCGDANDGSNPTLLEQPPVNRLAVDPDEIAHGWANVGRVTNGGAEADAAHTYTVENREQLIRALYPDADFEPDGTFQSANGPDHTPKIIYIKGTISLNTNLANEELTAEDYACEGWNFDAYKAAYNPKTWNKENFADGELPDILPCPGTQEALRECSRIRQRSVVQIKVGSNTSLFGLGDNAKIVHGHIIIGGAVPSGAPPQTGPAPLDPDLAEACGLEPEPQPEAPTPDPALRLKPTAENVIVRNITFEDAYDFFPAWTPSDSYSEPPEVADPESLYPLCQATIDEATDAGPHQCPGGRWNSSYDNITVQNAVHVWIDHNTFNDGSRDKQTSVWDAPYDSYAIRFQPHDGALDINGFSDFVTVSRNVFRNHDKVMLIGGSDTVRDTNGWGFLSVTVHNNSFINCGQRTPRVRFGKVHVYSNLIQGNRAPQISSEEDKANKPMPDYPMGSALAVGHLAKVYSENNVFELKAYPGDAEPTADNIIGTAHREPPAEGAGMGEQTYFFDAGSTFNGADAKLMDTVKKQVEDDEDPPVPSTADIWKPGDGYKYQAIAATAVKANVASSGAGKIAIVPKK
jgi:pectate lyase